MTIARGITGKCAQSVSSTGRQMLQTALAHSEINCYGLASLGKSSARSVTRKFGPSRKGWPLAPTSIRTFSSSRSSTFMVTDDSDTPLHRCVSPVEASSSSQRKLPNTSSGTAGTTTDSARSPKDLLAVSSGEESEGVLPAAAWSQEETQASIFKDMSAPAKGLSILGRPVKYSDAKTAESYIDALLTQQERLGEVQWVEFVEKHGKEEAAALQLLQDSMDWFKQVPASRRDSLNTSYKVFEAAEQLRSRLDLAREFQLMFISIRNLRMAIEDGADTSKHSQLDSSLNMVIGGSVNLMESCPLHIRAKQTEPLRRQLGLLKQVLSIELLNESVYEGGPARSAILSEIAS